MSLEVHFTNSGQENSVASRFPDDPFMVVDIDRHVDIPVDPVGQTDWVLFRGLRVSDVAAGLVRAAARKLPTERLLWCDVRIEVRPALAQSFVVDGTLELGF